MFLVQYSHAPVYFGFFDLKQYETWTEAREFIASLCMPETYARIVNPSGLISWAGRFGD